MAQLVNICPNCYMPNSLITNMKGKTRHLSQPWRSKDDLCFHCVIRHQGWILTVQSSCHNWSLPARIVPSSIQFGRLTGPPQTNFACWTCYMCSWLPSFLGLTYISYFTDKVPETRISGPDSHSSLQGLFHQLLILHFWLRPVARSNGEVWPTFPMCIRCKAGNQ